MLTDQAELFAAALLTDLHMDPETARRIEVGIVVREIDHALANIEEWLRPEELGEPENIRPANARVVREPLGVVLVIGPWNFPVHLLLAPLVGALAAGNCAVLKPSELAPHVSAVLAEQVAAYLDTDAVTVVEGGVPESTALLEQRFDHIFFTGGGAVGRIVLAAAARHLTPVTLELGGKSPAVVQPGVDLAVTARRLVEGKFLNSGQICVAPDYVLAIGDTAGELETHLVEAVQERFGGDPAGSPQYGRIVTTEHFDRIVRFLKDGRTVVGGDYSREAKYIAPTVLADVPCDASVMHEEIFGPVLPIVAVPDLDAAIAFINDRDKPLALYAFTDSEAAKQRIVAETSSGAVSFGTTVSHVSAPELPFGGVGASGMGRYHGEHSISTFSNAKTVLDKPLRG